MSLIVPDFKNFVFGSSCNSLFFGLIPSFLYQYIYFLLASRHDLGIPLNIIRKQRSDNEIDKLRIA